MGQISKAGTKQKGSEGEAIALGYFRKNGFKILECNWKTRRGEVDLIAEKKAAIYFVEVKFRKSLGFGKGEESIHPSKQRKMVMAALDYLQRKRIREKEIHFGGLVIDGSVSPMGIEWIEFPLDLPPQYY